MANVSKPNTFTANTTISSSQVNDNFDTIYNEFNGNISGANLAAGAVTSSKIADTVEIANLEITDSLTISGNQTAAGWDPIGGTLSVATGYNDGNKSFEIDSSTDLTTTLSPGMRFSTNTSGFTIPTQSTDLESSSSQYWSKSSPSGITFTDDFTCEAWVKLESYGSIMSIVSRQDGTNGWAFYLSASGALTIWGKNSGGTADFGETRQSLPLGRWVHVAGTLDMSTATAVLYIDGVVVPHGYTNGTSTSLTQAGNLNVGALNGGSPFDGKIAEVRVWSAIRTATEIQDNMSKVLTGSETNLVAYFPMNGNGNDSTANANNLTGQAGAVATDADNPYNLNSGKHYGIITKVTSTKITVFTGTDSFIPNATLTTPQYSTQKVPFGFPAGMDKWVVESHSQYSSTVSATNEVPGMDLVVPVGAWRLKGQASGQVQRTTGSGSSAHVALSTTKTSLTTDLALLTLASDWGTASAQPYQNGIPVPKEANILVTTPTTHYFVIGGLFSACTLNVTQSGIHKLTAECTYL